MACSTFMQNMYEGEKYAKLLTSFLFQWLIRPYIAFPVSALVKIPVSVGKENGITDSISRRKNRSRFYSSFSPLSPPSFSAAGFPIPSPEIED